jgi:hypothetical protein
MLTSAASILAELVATVLLKECARATTDGLTTQLDATFQDV